MAKLDKQGLNTFIRELDKHINTKINRLELNAEKINLKDTDELFEATTVESALKETKLSIEQVKGKIDGLELVASKVAMADGSTVEDAVSANKASILALQTELNGNVSTLENNINAIREVL